MRSSSGSAAENRDAWSSLPAYLRTHHGNIEQLLREGFLLDHNVRIEQAAPALVTIVGPLLCANDLVIHLARTLEQRGQQARTLKCSYHAAFIRPHRSIFRYDDAHPYPGHLDSHHKHVFDPPGAPEPGTVVWIGRDAWPTLVDVVRELQAWWETTGRFMAKPGR